MRAITGLVTVVTAVVILISLFLPWASVQSQAVGAFYKILTCQFRPPGAWR